MNILVISYVDCITDHIMDVIKRSGKNVKIDVTKGTSKARYLSGIKNYDLIVIDMMVQEFADEITMPMLEPAILFLKQLKTTKPCTRVFALFDEDETGKKGQDNVVDMGYEITSYNVSSIEWENKLLNYI